jgi:hypothetical protein
MFVRLSPAQATGIHGWGTKLKTTLTWRDIEENDHIDFDLLLKWGVSTKELRKLQPDVRMWVLHAGCKAQHAVQLIDFPAHPMRDLHGDLADVIALGANSRQMRAMGITYADMRAAGMTPETMRLIGIALQGWIDMGLTSAHVQSDFTDAQLGRVFVMTRTAIKSCFKEEEWF